MPVEQVTPQLIHRIEGFHGSFNAARFGALRDLPGNPYRVEVRRFGLAVAVKVGSPLLRGKQRVTGFGPWDEDHLPELLDWYRRDGLRCTILTAYGRVRAPLFHRLAGAGLTSRGSNGAYAWMDRVEPGGPVAGLTVRESTAADREAYLDLFQRCFAAGVEVQAEYRAVQWAEDALRAGKRYIAEVDGEPVAFGSMPVVGGIALCGTAGTLPGFRGRGIHRRLIEHRIGAAAEADGSLVLGGAYLDSTEHRNFVRCGFRMLPLGMSWTDSRPADAHA